MVDHELVAELESIRSELKHKQDRLKPAVWISLLIWILGATTAGTWWAADMSATLRGLEEALKNVSASRYRAADAEKDLKILDQKIEFLRIEVDELKRRK